MKNLLIIFISFFLTFLSFSTFGQGNYSPIGADFSFPRTIINQDDIPQVRQSLNNPKKNNLYQSILNTANSQIPILNSTQTTRRTRAHISREAAFIVLLNRKTENEELVPLTESDSIFYVNRVIDLLENLNDTVGFQDGWNFYWEWQLRSKELIHYLVAYDLLKGAGIADPALQEAKSKLISFTGNLYKRTTDFYPNPLLASVPLEFYSYNPNNHAIITCTTLGVAAIVLSDASSADENFQPINWMNSAMWNLDNALWKAEGLIPRVSESGQLAGYAEGANYFGYCFSNAMIFIRSMWNFLPDDSREYTFYDYNALSGNISNITREIRNPWYDESYHNLYEWMNRIRMPDGRYPAIHDSSTSFRTMTPALSGNPRFNILNPKSSYNSIWTRSQYISTLVDEGTYDESLFQALPEAGSLVFRSEYNNPEAVYMHLIGKNGIALAGAKAHHQADATSFQLYFNNEDLALDSGYSGSTYRADVEKATDHNLILVNGEGPGVPTSEWVNMDNTVVIENFFDLPNIDYGELRGGWQGANITRKALFLNNEYFILTDFVRSNNSNDYTYQLHGYGLEGQLPESTNGSFTQDFENNRAIYSRNNSNLLAHITSRGNTSYSANVDSLSLAANGFKYYSKMLVHENNVQNTEFLSILFPYKTSVAPIITKIIENGELNAHAIFTNVSKDLIFVQPENIDSEIPSLANNFSANVTSNGNINYLSFDFNDNFKSLFIENGSLLSIGDKEYFKTNDLLDIAFERNSANDIIGYISDEAIVEIYSDSSLVVEYGDISSTEYDPVQKKAIITFNGTTNFKLVNGEIISSLSNPSNDIFSFSLFPNPAQAKTNLRIKNSFGILDGIITLTDPTGKQYYQEKVSINKGSNNFQLTTKGLIPGLYFITLQTPHNKLVKKLLIHNF
jgi:hypothetical protein